MGMFEYSMIPLTAFRHLFASVAEEMGEALRQSAVSPNVKERLDYSCALLDARGQLVAHAAHIPVHLGSAHYTIPAILEVLSPKSGDVIILNDPHRGGTHLNDVTVVSPLYLGNRRIGFLMNRAHHADIGGVEPGSMVGAKDLTEEGLCLKPQHLIRQGKASAEVWKKFADVVRDPEATKGDLHAQIAALRRGQSRFLELVKRFGKKSTVEAMEGLVDHGEKLTRALLRSWPAGSAVACLHLDGPKTPQITCRTTLQSGKLRFDFSGTSPQVSGSWNTHQAVVASAVFYLLQSLAGEHLPETSGTLRCVQWKLPKRSLVASEPPAGVALGNVETSQRIVDVCMEALRPLFADAIPACSQGTMNNFLFGLRTKEGMSVYYETLCGGAGASADAHGASVVQSHMTNTRNTPIEVMEVELPVRVHQLRIRKGSGGKGRHRGGDGLVKEVEFLADARVTVAGTRRQEGAPGAEGGDAGQAGRDSLLRKNQPSQRLSCGESVDLKKGDRIIIRSPGGGGWGPPNKKGN